MTLPTPAAAIATAAIAEQVRREAEVVESRRSESAVSSPSVTATSKSDCPTTRPPVGAVLSAHLLPLSDHRTRRSPPPPVRPGIEAPAARPTFHTAPARPLARPEPAAAAAAASLESLPVGFEMTTACPICQMPIPFDASSSDVFSRHVDECISRVTREGPSASSRDPVSTERTCPVCRLAFPEVSVSQTDFERHVNNHFVDDDDADQQFQPVLS